MPHRLLQHLLAALIFITSIPLNAGCLFVIRNAYNHIFNKAKLSDSQKKIEAFLNKPDQALALDSNEISGALTFYDSGVNQETYIVPGGRYILKLPKWRHRKKNSNDPDFEKHRLSIIQNYQQLRYAEALFAKYLAPTQYGVTSDGIPFSIQEKVNIPVDPIRQRMALTKLVNKMRTEFPNLYYDAEEAFISVPVNGVSYKFRDLRHFNVGYFNGEPVMFDCPLQL